MKLASSVDTLDDSNLLKLHEGRCRLEQVRPERFRGLTWVELRAILAMLAEESVQVAEKLMEQTMEKRVFHIMRARGESRFSDLLIVTNSWVDGELVPASPRVPDCFCLIAAKVGLLQRLLFNKIVVPAIMEGESSLGVVAGVCAECLHSLGQTDIVDLGDYSAVAKAGIGMIALALRFATLQRRASMPSMRCTGGSAQM